MFLGGVFLPTKVEKLWEAIHAKQKETATVVTVSHKILKNVVEFAGNKAINHGMYFFFTGEFAEMLNLETTSVSTIKYFCYRPSMQTGAVCLCNKVVIKNGAPTNVQKTKEMIFDFRRGAETHDPLTINNCIVERVNEYKYLGTVVDDQLNWNRNTETIYSKANQRLYFLRKLKKFHVDRSILRLFYQSLIQSVLTFNLILYVRFTFTAE